MNLKQLQFVAHVAQTRSFSRAAELSFATQPTLSNAISQLEEELGGRLFHRTTRKVDLTPFGEHMLPKILDLLQNKEELYRAAESFHNPSHKLLRIGFSPLVDMQRLDQVLAPFREVHPEITLFFKECFIDDLAERLQKQQIDVQITAAISDETDENSCIFYTDPLHYIPSRDEQPSTDRLAYTLKELPDAPIIMTGGGCGLNAALEALFNQNEAKLNAYPGQAISYQVIEDWASLGIGAGILPRGKVSRDNKHSFPLFTSRDNPAQFNFIWRWLDQPQPDHLATFTDYIQTTVPSLIKGQVLHQA